MNCKNCHNSLPDLLLDPASPANVEVRDHLAACSSCKDEFTALQATFNLLDTWTAPEPSPYFDQKLAVRLREEIAAPPAGWFERLRSRLLFNTGRQFRPAMVGALALVIAIGGGTAANLSFQRHNQASAAINDLQILDNNVQALQTIDQLLQDDSSDDQADPPVS